MIDYINEHPGTTISAVRRAMDLSNGTANHHLNVLVREDLVITKRIGTKVHLFLNHHDSSKYQPLTSKQLEVLSHLDTSKGRTQKDIIGLTKYSQSTISWILKHLLALELIICCIDIDDNGRAIKHYQTAECASEIELNNCPYCGKGFQVIKNPKFCPFCGEAITIIS